ncbi:ABC transporter permease [Paenibacillus sp. GCM10027626]|uniref:ABC transporter permease n=1 Tax=Paenibacillus sp. GCM10027626 TaxID=3273411 RepID=UPI00363602A5
MSNNFWTVVGFTVRNKFKGKAFTITTVIIALIMSIGINMPYIISQFSSGESNATAIGYIEKSEGSGLFSEKQVAAMLSDYFNAAEKPDLKMVPFADTGAQESNEKILKEAISDGKIKGYIEFAPNAGTGFPDVIYKSEKLMEHGNTQALKIALQAIKTDSVLKDAGLTAEQKKMLNDPIEVNAVQITTAEGAGSVGQGKSNSQQAMDMGVVYVIIILLFMAIMITGQMIASEITAEKSSRVMEILITSVSPLKSMFGKIFGMFIVGLTQVLVYVAVIIINMTLPHNAEPLAALNIRLSDIDPVLLVYALIFYLAGYFLFATLFAAVGSIVSRTEDLGQAVLPITMIALAGFYICMFGGLNNPDSMLMKVSSFIPLFSPYAMVVRLGLSDPALWEVWLSIILLFATIYVAGWLSARIYRAGVLMYGKRPSFKELRKAMKAYKV